MIAAMIASTYCSVAMTGSTQPAFAVNAEETESVEAKVANNFAIAETPVDTNLETAAKVASNWQNASAATAERNRAAVEGMVASTH